MGVDIKITNDVDNSEEIDPALVQNEEYCSKCKVGH